MKIKFTKMHGAGNDFIVLDETSARYPLTRAHYQWLADRHFGVGADQLLSVRPSPAPDIDFEYVIHNADGAEVEQCGNGARCFAKFVHDKGLTKKSAFKVQTKAGVIEPYVDAQGQITINMGAPLFDVAQLPFDVSGLTAVSTDDWVQWPLNLNENEKYALERKAQLPTVRVCAVSMGNPHAVQRVEDVAQTEVIEQGALIENHPRFAQRVNAGFMQILSRTHIKLRVYERGVGETLACGSGACAAVVTGIRMGWLDHKVDVDALGGRLTIAWAGMKDAGAAQGDAHAVYMTGPATTVFEAEIEIPESLPTCTQF